FVVTFGRFSRCLHLLPVHFLNFISFVPLTPSIVWTYHTDQTRSFSKSLKCEYRREFGSEGLKIKVKMFMPSLIKKNDCTFSGSSHFLELTF
uniref:Uncharacterized protein n=1 Tax=Pundamilia nyererei TaxID=303518 RepID=A0A3B4H3S2_9CICH